MLPCFLSHDDQLASAELRLQLPAGDDNGRTLDLVAAMCCRLRAMPRSGSNKEWTIGLIAVQSFLDNLLPASAASHEIWLSDIKTSSPYPRAPSH